MEKSDLEIQNHIAQIAAVVVTFFAVLAIIFAVLRVFTKNEEINQSRVSLDLKIQVDSTYNTSNKDSLIVLFENQLMEIDQVVATEFNKSIQKFEENQEKLERAKENQTDFVTYASAILALILAVAGFFGFKSINEMKQAAVDVAKKEAINSAKLAMSEKYDDVSSYFDKTLLAQIENKIEVKKLSELDSIRSALFDLNKRISDCCDSSEENDEELSNPTLAITEKDNEENNHQEEKDIDLFTDEDLNY